jgi:hypothetical protein
MRSIITRSSAPKAVAAFSRYEIDYGHSPPSNLIEGGGGRGACSKLLGFLLNRERELGWNLFTCFRDVRECCFGKKRRRLVLGWCSIVGYRGSFMSHSNAMSGV